MLRPNKCMSICLLFPIALSVTQVLFAQLPAFPGAEGEAMWTAGGRGGDVYHVTNLNNSGPGSLREAVTIGNVPRTVVFDVSGTIALTSKLRITRPDITIAGQTAPGMGIVIRNYGTSFQANDTVVQHLRFRPGDAFKGPSPFQHDFAVGVSGQNVMLDHISASWSISQLVTINGSNFNDVTIQNSIMGEALDQTGIYHNAWNDDYLPGGSGHHANGLFVKPLAGGSGTHAATAHHNLLINNNNRNPTPGVYNALQSVLFDFRNNVIHNSCNSGYNSGSEGGSIEMNYVGNYYIAGPDTGSSSSRRVFRANDNTDLSIFQSGNLVDSDKDNNRDGTNRGWSAFDGPFTQLTQPTSMELVTTESADAAYDKVLGNAGAFWWNRDSVDTRMVNDVINNSGRSINSQEEVGGYPLIPVNQRSADWDTDLDGMPNWWEARYNHLDENGPDNNAIWPGGEGYTNLEIFLQSITEPLESADFDEDQDVDGIDFLTLQRGFGIPGGATGDADNNGIVDEDDLTVWELQFGAGGAPPATASVPEPSTATMLSLTFLLLSLKRRYPHADRLSITVRETFGH